jgi:hypothetical protein
MGIIILESPEAMETKLCICIHWVVLFKVYHLVINVDGKTKMAAISRGHILTWGSVKKPSIEKLIS